MTTMLSYVFVFLGVVHHYCFDNRTCHHSSLITIFFFLALSWFIDRLTRKMPTELHSKKVETPCPFVQGRWQPVGQGDYRPLPPIFAGIKAKTSPLKELLLVNLPPDFQAYLRPCLSLQKWICVIMNIIKFHMFHKTFFGMNFSNGSHAPTNA